MEYVKSNALLNNRKSSTDCIIIVIVIIIIICYHLYAGYLKLYTWNKPYYEGI